MTLWRGKNAGIWKKDEEEEEEALDCTKRINRSEVATSLLQDTLRNK